MANNNRKLSTMSLQLSPPPPPPPAEKFTKRVRKKTVPDEGIVNKECTGLTEAAKDKLYDVFMNDPVKKKMILTLINENKHLINEYKRKEAASCSSPRVNQIKKPVVFESPTALIRRRALEKRNVQEKLNFDRRYSTTDVKRKSPKNKLLSGVHAYIEVTDGSNIDKSDGVKKLLKSLGGTVAEKLDRSCTHVIFKDGKFETYKRTKNLKIQLVSIIWLDVVNKTGVRVDEKGYPALCSDYATISACNAICEQLNSSKHRLTKSDSTQTGNTSKSDANHRRTMLPSYTHTQLTNDLLDSANSDDDDVFEDVIPSSQSTADDTFHSITKRRETRRSVRIASSSSVEDDAHTRIRAAVLDSPFVNKSRRTTRTPMLYANENDSVENPKEIDDDPTWNKRKSGLSGKSKLSSKLTTLQEITENSSERPNDHTDDMPTKTVTKPARRILLSQDAINNIDCFRSANKTIANASDMDISTSNSSRPIAINIIENRKTNFTLAEMDIATPVVNKIIHTKTIGNQNYSSRTDEIDEVNKTHDRMSTGSACSSLFSTILQDKSTLLPTNDSKKTSTSSTRTSNTSENLSTYGARRITRRMTMSIAQLRRSEEMSPLHINDSSQSTQPTSALKTRVSNESEFDMSPLQALADSGSQKSLENSLKSLKVDSISEVRDVEPKDVPKKDNHSNRRLTRSASKLLSELRLVESAPLPTLRKTSAKSLVSQFECASSPQKSLDDEMANLNIRNSPANKRKSMRPTPVKASKTKTPKSAKTKQPHNNQLTKQTLASTYKNETSACDEELDGTSNAVLSLVEKTTSTAFSIASDFASMRAPSALSRRQRQNPYFDNAIPLVPQRSIQCNSLEELCRQLESHSSEASEGESDSNTEDVEVEADREEVPFYHQRESEERSERSVSEERSERSVSETNVEPPASSITVLSVHTVQQVDPALLAANAVAAANAAEAANTFDIVSAPTKRRLLQEDYDGSTVTTPETERRKRVEKERNPTKRKRLNAQVHDDPSDSESDQDVTGGSEESDLGSTLQPSQRIPLVLTQRVHPQRKTIVYTRFETDQAKKVRDVVQTLGGFTLAKNVTGETTHLIAHEAAVTINLVRAICRGIWVLRSDWLFDSEKAGNWLGEEYYEMTAFSPICREFRWQREAFGAPVIDIFKDKTFFIDDDCHPSKGILMELVIECKGKVVETAQDAMFVVGVKDYTPLASQRCVRPTWILCSIVFNRRK